MDLGFCLTDDLLSALSCTFNLAGFFLHNGNGEISVTLGCGVINLGISVCYKVLEQREGQDVVSLGPSKSCGPCVSQSEKQLVAGEPTEEMFYLKELHSRSCLPPVARGQGFRAEPPRPPGHVDSELGRLHKEG